MASKIRQKVTIIGLALGLGLLAYGFKFHTQPILSENNDKGLLTPESRLIKEVSIGGLKRDTDQKLHLTYSGKPPEACPT